jgi:hypothetical protein
MNKIAVAAVILVWMTLVGGIALIVAHFVSKFW